jgi:hypothetical protein
MRNGRAHTPTEESRKTVKMLTAFGTRHVDIAAMLEIEHDTLTRHYAKELESGLSEANAKVARRLFQLAMGDGREAITACIFWLKTKAKWRTSDVDALMAEIEELRSKLELAEERLSRMGKPTLVA